VPRVSPLGRRGLQDALELSRIRVGLLHPKAEGPRVAQRQYAVGPLGFLVGNFWIAQTLRVDRDRRFELVAAPAGTHPFSDGGIVDIQIGSRQYAGPEQAAHTPP